MEEIFLRKRALALWQEGQRVHLEGEVDRAIELYSESIAVFPTAEAHTFRAWALSTMDRYDDAIAECKKAISIDPSFGNPYNDIGSYLMALGRSEQAVTWLEKAKRAPRYEPRHFPYMNLGRLYASRGQVQNAVREYEAALRICPNEPTCVAAIGKLRHQLN